LAAAAYASKTDGGPLFAHVATVPGHLSDEQISALARRYSIVNIFNGHPRTHSACASVPRKRSRN
jgi:hypothetical protein